MSLHQLVLLQKPSSPHRASLEQALSQECAARYWRSEGPPLPPVNLDSEGLVLWDLTGFGAIEMNTLCLILAAGRAGVVAACPAVDGPTREALVGCRALGLLMLPAPPLAVAAVLEAARATQRQLFTLDQERESLTRQLAERDVIDRAKRALMAATGASEAEAMRQIQKHARDNNHKLAQVARRLLEGYRIFNGNGDKG